MTALKMSKINQLLSSYPSGIVYTSLWLSKLGYSLELQKHYRKSNWFQSIGKGAMIRSGETVNYLGGIYAIQEQLNMSIHVGARTALALQGRTHYLEFIDNNIMLFGAIGEKPPKWWNNHDWGLTINYRTTSFLPPDCGLTNIEYKSFSVKVSGTARAIMECLYLTPKNYDILQCYQLLLGLNNLRPNIVQELLEKCKSIKVKRLFLYLAEKTGHTWFNYIEVNNVELGKGKRSIVKNGIYIKKYMITVPKELENEEL